MSVINDGIAEEKLTNGEPSSSGHAETTDPASRFETAAIRILSDELPIPVRQRWQPLRAGLMNLFLFEDERFPFADGRLLIRGSNGTGKSRVLAMTLPLLLDGSFKATRVEPDRDPNRQVAWNVLMDDQQSATGYSWLECGRIDEAGEDHFLTIGCGMRATRGQPINSWFFVTERRVDESLSLKSIDGVPLTRRQLAETLGDAGQVVDNAAEYRRIVDERLFRLGERYDALIDLLLQLRQPQLAKKLDLDQLESALRQALPPLPETLLDDAAEAFRDLDQYRTSLASDRQTLRDIQRFLKPYWEHVRRGVKRSLKHLTSANSQFETAQRNLRSLTEQQAAGDQELRAAEERQKSLKREIESGFAAISKLQQSPEMRSVERLNEEISKTQKLSAQTASVGNELEAAKTELTNAQQQQGDIARQISAKRQAVIEESEAYRSDAAPEALQNKHRELVTTCLTGEMIETFESVKRELLRNIKRFQKSTEHLLKLNRVLDGLNQQLKTARANVVLNEQRRQELAAQLETATQQRDEIRSGLWESILNWIGGAKLLDGLLPVIETWSDQWHDWPAETYESDPSLAILAKAKSTAVSNLLTEQQRFVQQREKIDAAIELLAAERGRLELGEPIAPPPRSHRPTAEQTAVDARKSQFGVPFWQLVDFKSTVPQNERGNWEAALHDAGLLDARLMPDGRLVNFADDTSSDIQLAAIGMEALEASRQLAQVLVPSPSADQNFENEVIFGILRVIGVGANAGKTWVASDGTWRNGPLFGKLTKELPQFIGEEARERWRQVRLAEIENEISARSSEQKRIETEMESLAARQAAIEQLVESFPASRPLLDSVAAVTTAQRGFDAGAEQLRLSLEQEAVCQNQVDTATEQRDTDAADFGLSAWATRADVLHSKLEKYAANLNTLEARVDTVRSVIAQGEQCRLAVEKSQVNKSNIADRLNQLQTELASSEEIVRVLRESAGQGVDQIVKRLEDARREQAERERRAEEVAKELTKLNANLAVIKSKLEQAESDSQTFDDSRREATEWFSSLHQNRLLEFATEQSDIPELPWSMSVAIKVARQSSSLVEGISADDDAWSKSQNQVHQAQTSLQQTVLSQDGMAVDVEHLRDGLQLIKLTLQGERLAPDAAVARLNTDIENRDRILDEREQETLEKYLLGEVADGLRNGMRMAAELVEMMTKEVSDRPMKTGMQMRFKWRRDEEGPIGLAEACEVLATEPATWSPQEREQIKQFLQRSIRDQRERGEPGSWQDNMQAALDYRLWHRIIIERRSGPNANWLRLTKRTYGSGSGGEKAIALTLPQLAAVAAYYKSADPLAPRFILLDEAFAGISSDMRESCLELISAFGLDVVMTSENEWGMYAGVKQLAICQLDRFADINAVVNRVFIWNGVEKRQATSRGETAERERQPLFQED